MDIHSTYLAHSVPRGTTAEEATRDVIENQLPELGRLRASGEIAVDFVDVRDLLGWLFGRPAHFTSDRPLNI
jgi:hypothetical protein